MVTKPLVAGLEMPDAGDDKMASAYRDAASLHWGCADPSAAYLIESI
jgi:hypothetical protein